MRQHPVLALNRQAYTMSFTSPRLRSAACLFALLGCLNSAHAALTLSNSRIIHESDKNSSSVTVGNPSTKTYAAQAWVNTETDDTTTAVPLIASPALFRIQPGDEQSVQINRLPNDLPQDRESLFFFNLQEIPQAEANERNTLNIALRTRIKLFYRPSQLKGNPQTHLKDLKWSVQRLEGQLRLVVDNPSPFHFTFGMLEVKGKGKTEPLKGREMVAPFGRQTYTLASTTESDDLSLTLNAYNDYGGITPAITVPLPVAVQ
ncbi:MULTISPECIES: molecular chaperone [Pseudomonas]|uniref:Pili assembly chaperone n=3 Tax=Pseudomonas TaxID=286 RepID=A0A1L7N9N7_PSEPU|nr:MULTISPECIES: molecular chaperone [Pseudomonas]MBP2084566.1 chaperone protein EcpD [Pseudomonas sp. PvP089]MBP2089733.1 chaperone protein EcpD [Pseudomonas sp. PvP088]MCE0782680.1 molecular chaperone [Pseudomonas sp. NMI542_15]MBP2224104.1 chaperone protein EcpD [Pseudomonas putida]MDD2071448.1 molecular chaperone [Pseudomonas putida]